MDKYTELQNMLQNITQRRTDLDKRLANVVNDIRALQSEINTQSITQAPEIKLLDDLEAKEQERKQILLQMQAVNQPPAELAENLKSNRKFLSLIKDLEAEANQRIQALQTAYTAKYDLLVTKRAEYLQLVASMLQIEIDAQKTASQVTTAKELIQGQYSFSFNNLDVINRLTGAGVAPISSNEITCLADGKEYFKKWNS